MSANHYICIDCESEYEIIEHYSDNKICFCPYCGAQVVKEEDEE